MLPQRNKDGTFAKGNTLRAGKGRGKGNVNKITQMGRNAFLELLEERLPEFLRRWDELESKEWLDVYLRIYGHNVPKATLLEIQDSRSSALRDRLVEFTHPNESDIISAEYENVIEVKEDE